jgi:diaminohydroxyphosphoribosylaminopyrimidine deaminase/5-amino-6-(5-phosphoribosylamino)uracil reductase
MSTIYVSLEPCSHYGKTPPCADMLIEKGIRRVVIGCEDPFVKVHGRGIQKLLTAGCEVKVGVLEKECRQLIRKFITFNTVDRPYVTLKWAESADGFIGKNRCRTVLSTPLSTLLVQKRRTENDAIMVGTETARIGMVKTRSELCLIANCLYLGLFICSMDLFVHWFLPLLFLARIV